MSNANTGPIEAVRRDALEGADQSAQRRPEGLRAPADAHLTVPISKPQAFHSLANIRNLCTTGFICSANKQGGVSRLAGNRIAPGQLTRTRPDLCIELAISRGT